jgi:CHAD domain-containing protein
LLRKRASALARHLPSALAGSDRGVHQARVATRRLREAMPVLGSGLKLNKAKKARRKIRRLTRALGTVRELDVTLQLLDGMAADAKVPRAAIEDVRAHVLAERDKRRETMLERLEGVNTEKLGRRLASVAATLDERVTHPWRSALASRLLTRAKRLEASIDAAGQMYNPERLHAVRIASKKLRYALEIAADTGVPHASRQVRTMKRAQDLLGRLHDLQVLQAHAAAVQAEPAPSRHASRAALDTMAQHLEDGCRRLHAAYVTMVPKLHLVSAAVRTTIVPQLAQVTKRRQPLKMKLARDTHAAAGGR